MFSSTRRSRRGRRLVRATLAATALSIVFAGGGLAAKPAPAVTVECAWYPGDTTVTWTGFRGCPGRDQVGLQGYRLDRRVNDSHIRQPKGPFPHRADG